MHAKPDLRVFFFLLANLSFRLGDRGRYPAKPMANLLRARNIIVVLTGSLLYLAMQVCFFLHAASATTVAREYLGRGVFTESQMSREENFYSNGKDRTTFQIPKFNDKFRMHTASFNWNENRHIPPDASTNASDTWVGTCTLTPKSPWRQMDLFGVLGPIECSVYGDWMTDASQ